MGHDHDHEHKHKHSHHGHNTAAAQARPADLERHCAHGKVLFLDCVNGASGDMIVSALLDLGIPLQVVQGALDCLALEGYRLERGVRFRSGVTCASFEVKVETPQPERTWTSIDSLLDKSLLESGIKQLAREIFKVLGEAEALVHNTPLESVHFHEVGAVDSIVDIVGVSALLCWLGASEILCSPLPLGHGTVQSRHGVLPLPAPATLQCLRGIPTYGVDLEGELVTPTGAAILRVVVDRFVRWPNFSPERIGLGSGAREFEKRPNLLRAVLGAQEAMHESEHTILEANVDDMTGELAAHVVDRLLAAGALDVWLTPTTTKKGRPGLLVSAIAPSTKVDATTRAMLRDTTSLGVRLYPVSRVVRPRRGVEVNTAYGPIPLKISGGDYGPEQAKPEFDACVAAAEAAGVPVREVLAAALTAWRTGAQR